MFAWAFELFCPRSFDDHWPHLESCLLPRICAMNVDLRMELHAMYHDYQRVAPTPQTRSLPRVAAFPSARSAQLQVPDDLILVGKDDM